MKLFPITQKVSDKTFRPFRQAFDFLCVLRALCAFAVKSWETLLSRFWSGRRKTGWVLPFPLLPSPFPSLCLMLFLNNATAAPIEDHHFTNREGLSLHYLAAGSSPQTIVLVPGWLMPAAIFRRQLEALSDDYRVIAFDPRSQGASAVSKASHAPSRRIADLEDLLLAAGVGHYILGGWSLGVLEILDFVARTSLPPPRGLVLIDNSIGEGPAPKPVGPSTRAKSLSNPKTRERYLTDFCHGIFDTPPPADIAHAVLASALRVPTPVALELLNQPYPRTYWREIVSAQTVPILYAIRPRFAIQGEALLAKKAASAQVVIFENSGHALFVDDAPRFNQHLRDFAQTVFSNGSPPASNENRPSSGS